MTIFSEFNKSKFVTTNDCAVGVTYSNAFWVALSIKRLLWSKTKTKQSKCSANFHRTRLSNTKSYRILYQALRARFIANSRNPINVVLNTLAEISPVSAFDIQGGSLCRSQDVVRKQTGKENPFSAKKDTGKIVKKKKKNKLGKKKVKPSKT